MKRYSIISLYLLSISLLFSSCLKEDENPASGTPNPIAALPVVHNLYKGESIEITREKLSGAYITQGYVISDQRAGNVPAGQLIISYNWRSVNRGLTLFLTPEIASGYEQGDFIEINLENSKLERVNGTLGVTGLQSTQVRRIDSDNSLDVAALDIARLKANFSQFENTLVMVTADLVEFPEEGKTLAGRTMIIDGSGESVAIFVDPSADFSDIRLAPSASFRGIAFQGEQGIEIRLRNSNDLVEPSGPLYLGYPEDYEDPLASAKPSYNMVAIDNIVELKTGPWQMFQSILGDIQNRDRHVSGTQAVRFQQNLTVSAFLEMKYDLPKGASKVTFWYGSYFNDQGCTFQLESSTDQGQTWEIVGEPITDAHTFATSSIAKQASFIVDIREPVRFRINKLGLGPSNGTTVRNGRLGIDDFAVYENY
ncbi:DUF5689 domain-containing protein [Belliella kenyensis]|uniref:DUF5689 domain-containing protein n=1 Tax=Belliella kenyensis TaxID=1472724 RepID=A0ABV8EJL1_9BACT|nr:DUF5689 domain-containing protein [Belliella kenyensis]MCH7400310.1 DUF5689 domain-containing protein [Belliella kenyensis]MDN3604672.1 DUF5689 domain-containing protein [Belliella kenyensis]